MQSVHLLERYESHPLIWNGVNGHLHELQIGDDDNGQRYYAQLRKEGINVEGIHIEKGKPTGVATILVQETDGKYMNLIVIF